MSEDDRLGFTNPTFAMDDDPALWADEIEFGGASALYSEWVSKSSWDAEEAAALTLGYEPLYVNRDGLEGRLDSPLARRFHELLVFIEEAQEKRELPLRFSPSDYLQWAEATGHIELAPGLSEAVKAYERDVRILNARVEELTAECERLKRELQASSTNKLNVGGNKRSDTTTLKMIGVMARELFELEWPHPPGQMKAATALRELAKKHGLTIDDGASRPKLVEASKVCADQEPDD